jgi:hypothetical protein
MHVLITWRQTNAAAATVDERTHSVLEARVMSDPRATRRISKSVTTPAASCPFKSVHGSSTALGMLSLGRAEERTSASETHLWRDCESRSGAYTQGGRLGKPTWNDLTRLVGTTRCSSQRSSEAAQANLAASSQSLGFRLGSVKGRAPNLEATLTTYLSSALRGCRALLLLSTCRDV